MIVQSPISSSDRDLCSSFFPNFLFLARILNLFCHQSSKLMNVSLFQHLRFLLHSWLIPFSVNEETFWRNYFYRVSLLKQSTAANSLGGTCKRNGSTSSSEAEGPDEVSPSTEQPEFLKQQDSFRQDSVTSSSGIRRLDSKTEGETRSVLSFIFHLFITFTASSLDAHFISSPVSVSCSKASYFLYVWFVYPFLPPKTPISFHSIHPRTSITL